MASAEQHVHLSIRENDKEKLEELLNFLIISQYTESDCLVLIIEQ
jgi:hypothetical protein